MTERFSYDSEHSEQPIETKSNINYLLNKCGGKLIDVGGEKKLIFQPSLKSSGSGVGGFGQGQGGQDETNPHCGHRTNPLYESVWTTPTW